MSVTRTLFRLDRLSADARAVSQGPGAVGKSMSSAKASGGCGDAQGSRGGRASRLGRASG